MSSFRRDLFASCLVGSVILIIIGTAGISRYGSIRLAIQAFRPTQPVEGLLITSTPLSDDEIKPFSLLKVNFVIKNVSTKPITIVGDYNDCNCVHCDKTWPVVIGSGLAIEVCYSFFVPGPEKEFQQKVHVYTDSLTERDVTLTMSGRVGKKTEIPPPEIAAPVQDIR